MPAYSQIPDWYTSQSKNEYNLEYLTGSGQGSSANEALRNAQSRLSETFSVLVESGYMNRYLETSSVFNGDIITNEHDYTEDNIETYSKNNLINSEVLEIYHDKRKKQHYVLVGLHRENTANIIRNLILDNEKKLLNNFNSIDSDKIRQYCQMMSALETAKENEELASQLPILLENYTQNYVSYTHANEISTKAANIKKGIKFYINNGNELNSNLVVKIKSNISSLGMAVVSSKNFNPDYIISVNINLASHNPPKERWEEYHKGVAVLQIEILNTDGIALMQTTEFRIPRLQAKSKEELLERAQYNASGMSAIEEGLKESISLYMDELIAELSR